MLVRAGCMLRLPEDLENKEQPPGSESKMRDMMKIFIRRAAGVLVKETQEKKGQGNPGLQCSLCVIQDNCLWASRGI